MKELCTIALLFVLAPWVTGIGICLFKFFGEKVEKLEKWFALRKEEKQMQKNLKKYVDWYEKEQVAVIKACILNSRYERSSLFGKDDLKIWKAFI
jgi:hypothetical protein